MKIKNVVKDIGWTIIGSIVLIIISGIGAVMFKFFGFIIIPILYIAGFYATGQVVKMIYTIYKTS